MVDNVVFRKLDSENDQKLEEYFNLMQKSLDENSQKNFFLSQKADKEYYIRNKTFVLEYENKIVWYISYKQDKGKKSHNFTTLNMYIDSQYQGRGLGLYIKSQLIEYVISQYSDFKIIKFNTRITETNEKSLAVSKKLWFEIIGTDPMAIYDGKEYVGSVLMTKIVDRR